MLLCIPIALWKRFTAARENWNRVCTHWPTSGRTCQGAPASFRADQLDELTLSNSGDEGGASTAFSGGLGVVFAWKITRPSINGENVRGNPLQFVSWLTKSEIPAPPEGHH